VFIQVIKAKVKDREGVQRLGERWMAELRPGAEGFLGATIGITDDGTLVDLARFASREAAMANSGRAEQGAWWAEFEACLDGPAEFRDSDDVTVNQRGDLDSAGFVQVMEGRVHDVEAARAFSKESVDMLASERPDVLGEVEVIHPDGTFTTVVYFVSEAAAREAESAPPSEAMEKATARMGELMDVDAYYDLREPWLY
jgi:hypothetical protein